MEDNKKVTELAVGAEVGNIYYTYNEEKEDFDMYRIVSIQNKETVSCIVNGDWGNRKKFKLIELRENFTQLLSNAILTVSKVVVATKGKTPIYDIVVMVYKRDNTDTKFSLPNILCRQSISDIFYQPFCNAEENPMVGFSVTNDTLPAEYEMGDLIWMDEVIESSVINLYKTDTLESIYALVGNKYDSVLRELLSAHVKSKTSQEVWNYTKKHLPDNLHGYCKDLMTLLKVNNFMYDFYQMFGIINVTFKVDYLKGRTNSLSLPNEQREALQEIYQINMAKTMVVPFDFSIDLSEVTVPYVLVMDSTGSLYFIAYTRSEHEYVKQIDTTVVENAMTINQKILNAVEFYDKYSSK